MAGVTVLLGRAADAKQDQTTILLLRALDALSRCAAAANVYRPDDTAGAAGPAAAAAKAFSGKGLRASGSAANAVGSATSVLAHRSELPQSVGCLAALLENFGDSVILSDSSDRPDSARPNACAPALCPRCHSPIVLALRLVAFPVRASTVLTHAFSEGADSNSIPLVGCTVT